jgi:hypothetical protein
MKRRLLALIVLSIFVLGTASACVYKNHVPPGQIKKQSAPGQMKKH